MAMSKMTMNGMVDPTRSNGQAATNQTMRRSRSAQLINVKVQELIKSTPADQLIERLADFIYNRYQDDLSAVNLGEKLNEPKILELLQAVRFKFQVLHLLITYNPASAVEILKHVSDGVRFTQLIFVKDDAYQRNALSRAVRYAHSNVVRLIYARMNSADLYKLLRDPDGDGETALHIALWRDYPLDELLKPLTEAQSCNLLSIRNNEGRTVKSIQDEMQQYPKRGASSQDIDEWFSSTPADELIEKLAWTMMKWDFKNLDGLNLVGRLLKPDDSNKIAELLNFQLGTKMWPVLHYLVTDNPTYAVELLETINKDQFEQLIFMKDGRYGRNCLSRAVFVIQTNVVEYIYRRLNKTEQLNVKMYDLIKEQDKDGFTALYYASRRDYPFEALLRPFNNESSHKLLSIRNNEGQTVLSYIIAEEKLVSLKSLIQMYSGRQEQLLELAAIPDKKGNNSLKRAVECQTSDFLRALVQNTLTDESRAKLIEVLRLKNAAASGIVQSQLNSSNQLFSANRTIYRWVLKSIRNNQYLLFDYPKVLVFTNEANRDGAKKEADILIKYFRDQGCEVDVKTNKRREEMLKELKKASRIQFQTGMGLIVAIMTHGAEGCIFDNNGTQIDLQEIEKCMKYHSRDNPACLILQCCQNSTTPSSNETNTASLLQPEFGATSSLLNQVQMTEYSDVELCEETQLLPPTECSEDSPSPSGQLTSPYVPTSRHLFVFMSTIPGHPAKRSQYIEAFVKALKKLKAHNCISEAHPLAAAELRVTNKSQMPISHTTLTYKFCFKNALPIVLKRKEAEMDDEAYENEDDIQGEAEGGEQGGVQGGEDGSAYERDEEGF